MEEDKTVIRTILIEKDVSAEKILVQLFYYWPMVNLRLEMVGIARDMIEAMDLVRKEIPALVVIGWDMSGEMELVEQCHRDGYDSRFIILAHQECPELKRMATKFGASVVILNNKPEPLMKKIEELFQ